MSVREEKQQLVNITFEIALAVATDKWFQGKSNEEIAEWVAGQLRACGFDTEPRGASWGVLV